MLRKLILIANNGSKDNYLPGVTVDMKNYRQYFTSPEGGVWRDVEIKPYDNNCTKENLEKYINDRKSFVDYFEIVFCGHGYALDNKDTILELSPDHECAVSEIKSWLNGKYGILIADSCRKIYPVSTYIQDSLRERLFSLNENASDNYKETCRKLFLNSLDELGNKYKTGYFAEAYSCSLGECAHDDDQNGGFYSSSLLSQAIDDINKKRAVRSVLRSEVGFFADVHDPVATLVNAKSTLRYHEPQNPKRNNGRYIPFYVVPST